MSNDLITKYRPTKLEEVVGQDVAVRSIKTVLDDKTARTFIMYGNSGTGKTTLSRIIASMVGATEYIEVDAASNTGVDDMRKITEAIGYKSLSGGSKLICIDECHRLSGNAWDSLLKSIEEPPSGVYWSLCTTEMSKIPKAIIKGRGVLCELKPVSADLIYEVIGAVSDKEKFATPDDVLYFIAQKSDGSVRDALSKLAQFHNLKTRKEVAEALNSFSSEEGNDIDLIRGLVKGEMTWPKAMELLDKVKEMEGEGIRLRAVGYLTKVLLNTKDPAVAASLCNLLNCFSNPYPQGAKVYPVMLSLASYMFQG